MIRINGSTFVGVNGDYKIKCDLASLGFGFSFFRVFSFSRRVLGSVERSDADLFGGQAHVSVPIQETKSHKYVNTMMFVKETLIFALFVLFINSCYL